MSWFSIQELEYLLRIVLAAVCGGAIGFERERRSKSAGIRTHIIVALSAALMMVVSKYGFFDVIGLGGISLDASRVAAGVVTAIGFLGVGVIFTHGRTVSGVTTAAGLWATVGVGIAVGAGLYVTGGVATVLIVLFQVILHRSSPLVKTQRTGTVVLELSEAESDPAAPPAGGAGVRRGGGAGDPPGRREGRGEVRCALPRRVHRRGHPADTEGHARHPFGGDAPSGLTQERKRGRMYGSDNQRNQLAG